MEQPKNTTEAKSKSTTSERPTAPKDAVVKDVVAEATAGLTTTKAVAKKAAPK